MQMTKEEAIKIVKGYLTNSLPTDCYEEVEEIIKALEQQPCEDAVSRQVALSSLEELDWDTAYERSQVEGMLKSLPTVQPKSSWISVKDRLPKPYEQVLRTVKSIGWNGTSHVYVDVGTICPVDTNVLAWMSLPEPYKAESEG